jgi:glycosyltransferase involved in cell wall biosynthesis
MRILQVNSARTLGGGETHVLQLVEALSARGHTVAIAGRRDGPLKPEIALPFVNSGDLFTAYRLRSVLKREQFDVVHAHVARDYTIVAAAAWGVPNLKVVFTRHLLYPVRSHFLYERIDGWIAPTAQILRTLEPLKPKQSAVVPNWVDLERFPYRPHAFHSPVTVGLIGQISPHKGHADAIECLRQLGDGFRLVIAGTGEASYEEDLKRTAAGLPVEFTGFVSLPDFFKNIDIVIMPSWEEPFGIVLLEAMASGIPVIATNAGGPAEIVRGVLIPPHDPTALAKAIRSIRPGEFIREARAHVEKIFDIRIVVPQIEAFYLRMNPPSDQLTA